MIMVFLGLSSNESIKMSFKFKRLSFKGTIYNDQT